MKSYHILKRGSRFNFVLRIPKDLLGYFPVKVLYKSLGTADIKEARLLAASFEYETQRAFMRLRTNMLGTFEAQILVTRLTHKIKKIDAIAFGQKQRPILQAIEQHNVAELMEIHGCDERGARRIMAQGYADFASVLGESLADNDTTLTMRDVEDEDKVLRKEYKIMLSDDEKRGLALKFLNMDKELMLAEADVRAGDHEKLQRLRDRIGRDSKEVSKRFFLRDILKDYEASYDLPDKKGMTLNSWRAVKRHITFIYKVLGNIEFTELNSKVSADKLQQALNKRKKSTGDPLSQKEHGSYVKRLKSIVTFTMEKYEIDTTNKIKVNNKIVDADRRLSYSYKEIKRLEEALCSAPMLFGKGEQPRYDRFWIILIAVLHGFRKTSIVNLMGRHLIKDEQTGLLCFDLSKDRVLLQTKSDNMRALVPVHPLLYQIGFVAWVDNRNLTGDTRLFEDTPEGFGQWWNGMTPTSGWNYDYITQEDKKTFHSFRHYFCCCMDELYVSENHKNEMSGHAGCSRGRGVRSKNYLERTRVKTMADTFLKSIEPERILMTDLNWERLRERAKKLFFT